MIASIRRGWLVVGLLTASVAEAQMSGGAIEAPAGILRVDTTGLVVRAIGLQAASRRSTLSGTQFGQKSVTLRGGEIVVLGREAGVQVRYLDGATPEGTVRDVDARFLFGSGSSFIELGYVQRQMPERPDSSIGLGRVGLRLLYEIGGSGGAVHLGGGAMLGIARGDSTTKADRGWDAEATFRYNFGRWRLPVEGMVGYRMSVVRAAKQEEEMGQVLMGLGIRLAGR